MGCACLFPTCLPPCQHYGTSPQAVETCKKASIKVFMVTGDHPITAKCVT